MKLIVLSPANLFAPFRLPVSEALSTVADLAKEITARIAAAHPGAAVTALYDTSGALLHFPDSIQSVLSDGEQVLVRTSAPSTSSTSSTATAIQIEQHTDTAAASTSAVPNIRSMLLENVPSGFHTFRVYSLHGGEARGELVALSASSTFRALQSAVLTAFEQPSDARVFLFTSSSHLSADAAKSIDALGDRKAHV